MKKMLCVVLTVLCICLTLTGCNGGSNNSINPGVSLKIGASTTLAMGMDRAKILIGGQLDQGAKIEVFNFQTGALITSGTIGSDGFGSVTLTPGLVVVVVITGKRDGKDFRLSLLLPSVPNGDITVVANPITTIASELIGEKFYKKSLIDSDVYEKILLEAQKWCIDHPTVSSAITEHYMLPGGFGNIDESKFIDISAMIPATIDNSVVKGKNAIQQVREAGLPFRMLLNQETPSLRKIATAVNTAFNGDKIAAIQTNYSKIGGNLSRLMLPAIQASWEMTDANGNPIEGKTPNIFKLEMGKGYRIIQHIEEYGYNEYFYNLTFYPDSTLDIPNQITMKMAVIGDFYTLTLKKDSNGWIMEQTAVVDTKLKYTLIIPTVSLNADPIAHGLFSFTDKNLITPVTFDGTAKATGVDKNHYSRIEFNGKLTSKEFEANGEFAADFVKELPLNAYPGDKIYDYLTGFTMTNAYIQFTSIKGVAKMGGSLVVKSEILQVNDRPRSFPTDYQLNEGIMSVTINGETLTDKVALSFGGSIGVKLVNALYNTSYESIPVNFYSNAKISVESPAGDVIVEGLFNATSKQIVMKGRPTAMPNYAKLVGKYSNSDSKMAINGTIEVRLNNPTDNMTVDKANTLMTIIGDIKQGEYQPYAVNIVFSTDGNGKAICDMNTMKFGNYSLNGNGEATITLVGNETKVSNAILVINNQDGVKVTLSQGTDNVMTGVISVDGKNVANIAPGLPGNSTTITFTDGTTEVLM